MILTINGPHYERLNDHINGLMAIPLALQDVLRIIPVKDDRVLPEELVKNLLNTGPVAEMLGKTMRKAMRKPMENHGKRFFLSEND